MRVLARVCACVLAFAACAYFGHVQAQEAPQAAPSADAAAPAATPRAQAPIYADGLAAGWENWSWAQVTLGVHASDDERPMQVSAGGWQALFLHHEAFGTSGFNKLSFWINGGPHGGQTIAIDALDEEGHPIIDRAMLVTPPVNDWMLVEVSLERLGAKDRNITGFWLQNGTPDQTAPFFVNYISLE